jgi:hypothetical protein
VLPFHGGTPLVGPFLAGDVLVSAALTLGPGSSLVTARTTAVLPRRTSHIVHLELPDYRRIALDELEPIGDVFYKIREVKEGILFLADIHEGGLDAWHDATNAGKKDVANGSFMLLVFDKQLRKIAILHNGDSGLFPAVDDDFLGHEWSVYGPRSPGITAGDTRRPAYVINSVKGREASCRSSDGWDRRALVIHVDTAFRTARQNVPSRIIGVRNRPMEMRCGMGAFI